MVEGEGGEAKMWDRIVEKMGPTFPGGMMMEVQQQQSGKEEGWGGVAGTKPEFFADGEEALKAEEGLLRSLTGGSGGGTKDNGKGKGKGKEKEQGERMKAVGRESRAYGTKSSRILGQLLAVVNGGQEDDVGRRSWEGEEAGVMKSERNVAMVQEPTVSVPHPTLSSVMI